MTVWDATYIVSDDGPNFCGACIRYRNDLDELSISDSLCLQCGEKRIHVDIPFCTEPGEGLRSDDGPSPDKSPLRASNVSLVPLLG